MRVLAIETSTKILSAAVIGDDGLSLDLNYDFKLRHGSHLVPAIEALLKFAGMALQDIDAYCVSIGPGSFTGLRIGVAAVKALAVSSGKKVAAVPSLDALAMNVFSKDSFIKPVIDAKKGNVYTCLYKYGRDGRLKRLSKHSLVPASGALEKIKKPTVVLGDGVNVCDVKHPDITALPESFWQPKAKVVGEIGLEMVKNGDVENPDTLVPFYIYPEDVQCRKKNTSGPPGRK
ncbi:MAG: tRNA (adenosine(37)-N6)-threonylcarbamoyltransferase complex dimerization subunit type 1 TsaB [Candidatus Omnitrophota bacterium]